MSDASTPRWAVLSTGVLAVLGLAVSAYLTVAHYNSHATLACPASSTVNCEKVTTSAESTIIGIPVAVLGLAFFVVLVALMSPPAWRSARSAVHLVRLAAVVAGMCFVLWLVYAEVAKIKAICLWCTAVHVITLLIFAITVAVTVLRGIIPVPVSDPDAR